jgi:serine/threonine protein kinase
VLKATMDKNSKQEMKKEAFVMKELSHPCIVRLYGVSQSRKMNSTLMVLINSSKKLFSIEWLNKKLSRLLLYLQEKNRNYPSLWLSVQAN